MPDNSKPDMGAGTIPVEKPKSRDETITFSTQGAGRTQSPSEPRGDDTEKTVVVTDEGSTEIGAPYDESISALYQLPTRKYAVDEVILDGNEYLPGFLIILSGTAAETCISPRGVPEAKPITLVTGNVIGMCRNVRVKANTEVVVVPVTTTELLEDGRQVYRQVVALLLEETVERMTDIRRGFCAFREKTAAREQLRAQEQKILAEENETRVVDNARISRRVISLERQLREQVGLNTTLRQQLEEAEAVIAERTEQLRDLRKQFLRLAKFARIFERMIGTGDPVLAGFGHDMLTILYDLGGMPED